MSHSGASLNPRDAKAVVKYLHGLDGYVIARLIAAGALFLALRRWPYSYYTILRWAVCIIAAYSAFRALDVGRRAWAWIFVALAILFNPIAPIHFARRTWNLLDMLAAIVLLLSVVGLKRGSGKGNTP